MPLIAIASSRAVETCGGAIGVLDMPGIGCVFTLDFPRHMNKTACESPAGAKAG